MIIGLNGYARSGKNTVAEIIQDEFSDSFEIQEDSFAARLKLSAMRNFFPDIDLDEAIKLSNRLKEQGTVGLDFGDEGLAVSGREFLQHYGTEAHRAVFGDDFWIDQVLTDDEYAFGRSDVELLLITDVRFPNEAKAVQKIGGQVWRVNRDEVKPANEHSSEQRLDDDLVDIEIDNNGSLDHLRLSVIRTLAKVFLKVPA